MFVGILFVLVFVIFMVPEGTGEIASPQPSAHAAATRGGSGSRMPPGVTHTKGRRLSSRRSRAPRSSKLVNVETRGTHGGVSRTILDPGTSSSRHSFVSLKILLATKIITTTH